MEAQITQTKQPKTPFILKGIQTLYPIMEKIAPMIAYKWAWSLFFTPVRYTMPKREEGVIERAKKLDLTYKDKKVQVYQWGDVNKPAVLMVHGWSGRGGQFFAFVEQFLKEGFQVIAFDAPGHGASEGKQTSVLEFEQIIGKINQQFGPFQAAIGHSLGGAALAYGTTKGLDIPVMTFIGSPASATYILDGFLQKINGSKKTGKKMDQWVARDFKMSFAQFGIEYNIESLPENLLLVHDKEDREVHFTQSERVASVKEEAELFLTSGLGHTRLLRENQVVEKTVGFVKERVGVIQVN